MTRTGGLDTWKSRHSPKDLVVKCHSSCRRKVPCENKRRRQHVFSLEAGVDLAQEQEASDRQSGADHERYRKGYLGDHQGPAQTPVPDDTCCCTIILLQRLIQIHAGSSQPRGDPEQ